MKNKPKRIILLCLSVLIFLLTLVYYSPYKNIIPIYRSNTLSIAQYQLLKNKTIERLKNGATIQEICKTIGNDFFPYWYGTLYNFNGTTETPGKGKIACGYFVTTILRDAGLIIKREKLARMASEKMIESILNKSYIDQYSQVELTAFIQALGKPNNQLYIIGLDTHTGFILADKQNWYMVHSSGRWPFCVVKEKVSESIVLKKSKYKVIGRLSDASVIKKIIVNNTIGL